MTRYKSPDTTLLNFPLWDKPSFCRTLLPPREGASSLPLCTHQPASPPSSLGFPCPDNPFSAGSQSFNCFLSIGSLLATWNMLLSLFHTIGKMELLPLLIFLFQFCPNFFFLSQPYLEDLPILSTPHDPPSSPRPSGPFTEMDLAEVTNDFPVASSNAQFYSYSIASDTFKFCICPLTCISISS